MERKIVNIFDFSVKAHDIWDRQNLLLTSGDFELGKFNTMTVGWGSFGTMWNLPIAMIVVRPVRYTFEFIERYDTFTLCTFSADYRKALQILGVRSGRTGNKIAEAGLTPAAASRTAAPIFAEAELAVECRKLYWEDFNPEHFLDPMLDHHYPRRDYHRMVFGEILQITTSS